MMLTLLSTDSKTELLELLPFLTPQELEELDRLATINKLWNPVSTPQTLAYFSPADELFYGGAAGGGKTDLLLGVTTTAHRKSIIFRREYPQLLDIINRSHELLDPTPARFNGQENVWRNIPGNRQLEFGAVQYEGDVQKYKGRAHDCKCFDELTDFSEQQYTFLTAWTRTSVPGQRTRIIGASNPPMSDAGVWVIKRWAPWLDKQSSNPALPGDLRWFAKIDNIDTEVDGPQIFSYKGEEVKPRSRTFISARWTDNPYMVASGYGAILDGLPEPLRSILKNGDFFAQRQDDLWQCIPSAWIAAAQDRWRDSTKPAGPCEQIGLDPSRGGSDDTVFAARYEDWIGPLTKFPGVTIPDGQAVMARAQEFLSSNPGDPEFAIDVIGIGASAYDLMKEVLNVWAFNASESSLEFDITGKFSFANRRAEAWWQMRERLDPALNPTAMLPPDAELAADLAAPRWSVRSGGVIAIEGKPDIYKRLGRSTNCGDAVVMAFADPPITEISIYHGAV